MEILTREQCFETPIDIIAGYNAAWRQAIKLSHKPWTFFTLKYPHANIDNYIIKNFPELAFQFVFADMSTHERLQARYQTDFSKCYDSNDAENSQKNTVNL
jgi:hypothetical protein